MTDYPIYWMVSGDLPASGPKLEDSGTIVTKSDWHRRGFGVGPNSERRFDLQTVVDTETPGRKVNFFLLVVENKEMYPYVSFSTSDGRVFKLDGPLILIGKGAMALLGRLSLTITNNSSTNTAAIEVIAGIE